jgi:hypothetical protein
MEEAHLDAGHILAAIERFVRGRPRRLAVLRDRLSEADTR